MKLMIVSCIINNITSQNISFKTSNIQLPLPLTNHISAPYSNELHIIGGYINGNKSNPSPNIYVLNGNIDNHEENQTTITTLTENYPSFFSNSSIFCNGQCSVTINNKIYIFQTAQILYDFNTPWMLIYDLDTSSFVSSNNYLYDLVDANANDGGNECDRIIKRFLVDQSTLCAFGDDLNNMVHFITYWDFTPYNPIMFINAETNEIIVGGCDEGIVFDTSPLTHKVFTYDINNNIWSSKFMYMVAERDNYGCSLDTDGILYVMGGEYKNGGIIGQSIEKCTESTYSYGCSVISSELVYPRSDLKITNIMDNHMLIHGGNEHVEIFNATKSEIVTDSIPWNIGELNVSSYSWFIDDDLFVITGGNPRNTMQNIEYINVSQIFTEPPINITFEWKQSCITRYNAFDANKNVDSYLLEQKQLRFEVLDRHPVPNSFHTYRWDIYGITNEHANPAVRYERIDNNTAQVNYQWRPSGGGVGTATMEFDLDELSALTGVDMTGPGHTTVLWMDWSDQYWYVLCDIVNQ